MHLGKVLHTISHQERVACVKLVQMWQKNLKKYTKSLSFDQKTRSIVQSLIEKDPIADNTNIEDIYIIMAMLDFQIHFVEDASAFLGDGREMSAEQMVKLFS